MLVAGDVGDGDLVAVELPPGPGWIDTIETLWSRGAAVFPIDTRLARAERDAVLERAHATVVVGSSGTSRSTPPRDDLGATRLVVHTSGTTGEPKLVALPGNAAEAAVRASGHVLRADDTDRWLCCLPPAHIGGLLVLLRGVVLGSPVTVHERFHESAVATSGADFVSIVPTMLVRLLEAGADLGRFRALLVGGASLRADVRSRAERAGATVVETYGSTETCGGVVYDGVPFPDAEVRAPDGCIEVRGPTLMTGYLDDARATNAALTEDGWLRTGDAGAIETGALRVLGRLDEAITSGGETIWPREVEEALSSHPKVADVGVARRVDPEWGQRVVAFVVGADPSDPPSLDELRDHASETIARFKAPRELVLVDELPRTAGGKLRRRDLEDMPEE